MIVAIDGEQTSYSLYTPCRLSPPHPPSSTAECSQILHQTFNLVTEVFFHVFTLVNPTLPEHSVITQHGGVASVQQRHRGILATYCPSRKIKE